MIIGFYLK